MIQNIIVTIIVILSVIYLARKFIFNKKSKGQCQGCDRCCQNKSDCVR
ncbi:hypothetical protein BMT54_10625 [Pasteurellaceae bacterium 15-036681]|nr:hypothetical protein BMT54_10625 [Pasteurellaceae bacterium 15-036681]